MRLRSSTRVAKTVERYAAFIAGVEPEGDDPGCGDAAEHAHRALALLAARGHERRQAEDERNDAEADRERAGGPVAEHEDAVLPVRRHRVPLLRVVARRPR